ncbi:serine hydrolase [Nocardia arthritidis]|uniref:Serine hydrolase n=1 Tax=Nocardia arthritidis TaxID=228602 RepID=A0A6G9YHT0_9NOCA|nr:serine hydrolase [Nocardia arthritidis]QIS12865.1 serine hydrolase [Nocardia arthritidis]
MTATTRTGSAEAQRRIADVFAAAGAEGNLHARALDSPAEIGWAADEPVVLASVFKIPVALAYARQVAAGALDPAERTTVTARDRIGGIGTAGCTDDVEMSWRDLAAFALTMSDNAATDVLLRRVGIDAVREVLAELGLHRTRLIGGCEDLFATVRQDLSSQFPDIDPGDLDALFAAANPEQLRALSVCDPARTTASTPREITALLAAIWQDTAGPAAACAEVRAIMHRQIWPHRLSSGFGDEVLIGAKTGTLPFVRNEAGVLTFPDEKRYAVAIFTVAAQANLRAPAIDAAIGSAARIAVDALRDAESAN